MFVRYLFGVGVIGAGLFAPAPAAGGTLSAQPTYADTLTINLDEARKRALAGNPGFAADIARWQAALGGVAQARVFPFNPEIGGESLGSLSSGNLGEYEARISQEIPLAGQWGLSIDVAEAQAAATQWSSLDGARTLLREVEGAFFAAAAADRRLAVAEDINILNDSLRNALVTLLAEGEVSALDASLASIEAARGRARALSARRESSEARLELARLLGLPLDQALDLVVNDAITDFEPTFTLERALSTAYLSRPDLRAAEERVVGAEANMKLASRQALPNPVVSAVANRVEQGQSSRFGIGISLPFPVFDRRQGARSRALAEVSAAEHEREDQRNRLETEVRTAFAAVRIAREEVEILTNQVLLPARENHGLLEIAYREGKMDLSTLLLIRNQLLDAQMSYWDAWQRWREAEADIRSASGAVLDSYELPAGLTR